MLEIKFNFYFLVSNLMLPNSSTFCKNNFLFNFTLSSNKKIAKLEEKVDPNVLTSSRFSLTHEKKQIDTKILSLFIATKQESIQ